MAGGVLSSGRRFRQRPRARQLGHIDLTSLSQASREQADRAVDAVVERLDRGRTDPVSSVLMPQLVVRGTTATPAGP
jgi:DNA-binding LacI/PurR family transcriptional regulator